MNDVDSTEENFTESKETFIVFDNVGGVCVSATFLLFAKCISLNPTGIYNRSITRCFTMIKLRTVESNA